MYRRLLSYSMSHPLLCIFIDGADIIQILELTDALLGVECVQYNISNETMHTTEKFVVLP